MTINPLFLNCSIIIFIYLFIYFLHFMVSLCRPHWLVLILNSKQSYHISIVTVLLRIVTTIRILIKSPEDGRFDCPKYRESQLARRFFFAVFSF